MPLEAANDLAEYRHERERYWNALTRWAIDMDDMEERHRIERRQERAAARWAYLERLEEAGELGRKSPAIIAVAKRRPLRASFHSEKQIALLKAAAGKTRAFTLNPAYSGGAVRLDGWPLPLVIDLATLKQGKRITANLDHDRKQRVGHVTKVVNSGMSLSLFGVVSAATEFAAAFVASFDSDYPWGCSIEVAFARGDVVELRPKETVAINGRSVPGPVLIGRNGTLFGVALSDSPADETTNVTVAATAAQL